MSKSKYICPICGKPLGSPRKKNQKYCSEECAHEAKKEYIRKWQSARRKEAIEVTKECAECHREFATKKSNQRFCCPECKQAYMRRYWATYARERYRTDEEFRKKRLRGAHDALKRKTFEDRYEYMLDKANTVISMVENGEAPEKIASFLNSLTNSKYDLSKSFENQSIK